MPTASIEKSDNSIASAEKHEPKDVFQDLQNVIQELDTRNPSDKLSAKVSAESEDAASTLGESIGIKPK